MFESPRARAVAMIATVLVLSLGSAAAAGPARADEGEAAPSAEVDCTPGAETTLRVVECAGIEPVDSLDPLDTPTAVMRAAAISAEKSSLPANCRYHSEAAFYAATDWIRLVKSLSEDASRCADFFVSVPPIVADKTRLRPPEAGRIAAFGRQFHPMAEIHYATWSTWRATNKKSFYEAGVEAGGRVVAAGYETWALNELPSSVRQGQPGTRTNASDFIRGLHAGSGVAGLVFVTGIGQRTSPLTVYHTNLGNWLLDSLFWSQISGAVRFWAQEVYGDIRAWAVPGESRHARATHLAAYLMHGLELAEALGEPAAMARDVMRATYLPLTNVAWRWTSGFGFTDVEVDLMQQYVSEQVYAVRQYSGSHPHVGPAGRWGGAWAPRPQAPIDLPNTALILARTASALHEAYEEGGGSQVGACGRPGDHDWCGGEYPDAAFVDWSLFSTW